MRKRPMPYPAQLVDSVLRTLPHLPKHFKAAAAIFNSNLKRFVRRLKPSAAKSASDCWVFEQTEHWSCPIPSAAQQTGPDPDKFNCRVNLLERQNDNCDAFAVEIFGDIHAPQPLHFVNVQICLVDATQTQDDDRQPAGVHSRLPQYTNGDSPQFVYTLELGRLPEKVTTLSQWMPVAQINCDWLLFARKRTRELVFTTQIISRDTSAVLESAQSIFTYENPDLGYIDLHENLQRTKSLAVALGFTVCAADGRLFASEIDTVKAWARDNIDLARASQQARLTLEKALDKTVAFFRDGGSLDICGICEELVLIASVGQRYDIVQLCLTVAKAKGSVNQQEMSLLKDLADRLRLDEHRFRQMLQKSLPAHLHEVQDIETILGVTPDMSQDQARRILNDQYRTWNARVTNSDPEVQAQADHMLSLIAHTRAETIH